jgi:ABC-type polysaccharide/polyol phosphate export systems, permease component
LTPAANGRSIAAEPEERGNDAPAPASGRPGDLAYDSFVDDESSPTYAEDLREAGTELWRFREMLYQLTLRDVRIRYKQAVIGFGWALLMPALVVLSGCLVRYAMSRKSGAPLDLAGIASIAVKALPWSFFVGTISFATQSLTGNLQLVSKVYFPRAVLPLAATLGQAFDAAIGGLVLVLVLPFLDVHLSAQLLWVPVLLLLLFLLTVAASLFLSCANLFFRDVKYIVQVMLTFGIFFTPVFFDPAMMGQRLAPLIMLNPLSPLLEGLRLAIVDHHDLLLPLVASDGVVVWSPGYLVYAALWAILGLVVSAMIFHRSEFVFAEYV